MEKNVLDRALGLIAFIWMVCALVSFGKHYVPGQNLWFDESAQFWIALGRDHFSAPNLAPLGISAVWSSNQASSIDPGGFTLLLRGWFELFGGSATALRSLPFFFFSLMMLFCIKIAREFSTSWLVCGLAAAVVFFYSQLLHFSVEVRPYSMEACGVVFSVIVLFSLIKNPSVFKSALLSLVTVVFVYSRYGFALFAAPLIGTALYLTVQNKLRVKQFAVFSIPIVFAVFTAYLDRFGFGKTEIKPPPYVKSALLKYGNWSQTIEILKVNFLSAEAIPLTLVLILSPLLILFNKSIRLKAFAIYVWLVTAMWALLSLMGKMPWRMDGRWSLSLHALSVASVVVMGSVLLNFVQKKMDGIRFRKFWPILAIILIGSICWPAYKNARTFFRYWDDSNFELLAHLDAVSSSSSKIFVSTYAEPTVRYLHEYGAKKGLAKDYPVRFIFESQRNPNNDPSFKIKDSDLEYVLVGRLDDVLLAQYSKRIAMPTVEVKGLTPPSRLLRVIPKGATGR